jgi:multiple sugar transport system ATP-binding protein
VAGLVEVDAGEVEIAGRGMDGVQPYHRNVAMAFESYALYPQRTVSENLASPLRSGRTGRYDQAAQRERIDAVTTTLGINHLLQRFPRELSNGQRQRVALGRVLVRPADAYLLDEPLSHLDAKLRAAMRRELKQLGAVSRTTTLYVTHDYQEALALGDRVAVLRRGRLVQVGTPEEVWLRPVDTFVAKSLGQPEVNLLDATVEDGHLVVAGGGVRVPVPPGSGLGAGDRARVGLRPRDIGVVRSGAPARPPGEVVPITGRVVLAERLGRSVELTVDAAGQQLIVVDDGQAHAREGDAVQLVVPRHLVLLFASGDDGEESPRLVGRGTPDRAASAAGAAPVDGAPRP